MFVGNVGVKGKNVFYKEGLKMKIKEAAFMVLTSMILPLIFLKAYKNQVIADNKIVMKWRRLQFKKVGLDLGVAFQKCEDQAPLMTEASIINN